MPTHTHWTSTYIIHRIQDILYRKMNPESPWLTPKSIDFLKTILKSESLGLEYGSGRSTTWFAGQIKHLVSIEHNPEWFSRVSDKINQLGLNNVEYHLRSKPVESDNLLELANSSYVQAAESLKAYSLNFVLIDGVVRPACVLRAIPLLINGGWLILDDANHYLPGTSLAPNSRSLKDGPLNEQWVEVELALKGWKATWFGNGVKETLIFQKPF
jgi:predicted O-methyltransferase YrrM